MTGINPSFYNNSVRMMKTIIQPKEVEQMNEEIQKVTEEAAQTEQTAKPGMGDADTSQYLANMGIKIEKSKGIKSKVKADLVDKTEAHADVKVDTKSDNTDDEEPVALKGPGKFVRKGLVKGAKWAAGKAKQAWNYVKSKSKELYASFCGGVWNASTDDDK